MNIDDFADKYSINSMGIPLDKDGLRKKKKELAKSKHYNEWLPSNHWIKTHNYKIFKNFKTMEKQQKYLQDLRTQFGYRALDTSNIFQVDIDITDSEIETVPDDWWKFIEYLKQNTSYFTSTTKKKGLHFFVKSDWKPTDNKKILKYNLRAKDNEWGIIGDSQIELLCGVWGWCPQSNPVVDNGILHVSEETILSWLPSSKEQVKTEKKQSVARANIKLEIPDEEFNNEQKQYLSLGNIINMEYIDSYDSWTKIVWALGNDSVNNNYSVAKAISKRSAKYKEKSFNQLWDNSRGGNTIGTFFHYAKISNEKEYYKIRAEYWADFEFLDDDDNLANFYIDTNKSNHVCVDGDLYTFYHGKWRLEEKKSHFLKILLPEVIKKIACELKDTVGREIKKYACESDKSMFNSFIEKEKKVNKLLGRINTMAKIDSSTSRTMNYLATQDYSEIEFETKQHYLAFKDVVFDLDLLQQINPKREDYILKDTGFNYREPTKKETDLVDKIWNEIFPNKEIGNTYLHILATALTGYSPEKFIFANGGGRNGKGVINELFGELMGNYYHQCAAGILLNTQSLGACPAVAHMDNMRVVIYREPDEKKTINTNFVKELTGSETINGRLLFSNKNTVHLKATHILEANKLPLLDGEINQAVIQRLVGIEFQSTFTDDENDLKLDGFYPINPYYKTKDFKANHKYALLKKIMDYMRDFKAENGVNVWEKFPIPKKVKETTQAYLDKCDGIKTWLKTVIETCDISGKTAAEIVAEGLYIKPSDIVKSLKCSELWEHFTKEERRQYNDQYFQNYFKRTRPYSVKYKEHLHKKRNCLTGYKFSENDDSDSSDGEL